jgi:hypothetical protein
MTPTREDVIRHLKQLRASLAFSMANTGEAKRYNDARAQLQGLDAQLRVMGIEPEPTPPFVSNKERLMAMPRKRRHAHIVKAGNSFTERMRAKFGKVKS